MIRLLFVAPYHQLFLPMANTHCISHWWWVSGKKPFLLITCCFPWGSESVHVPMHHSTAEKAIAFALLHFQIASPKVNKDWMLSNIRQVLQMHSAFIRQVFSSSLRMTMFTPYILNSYIREQKRTKQSRRSYSVSLWTVCYLNAHEPRCKRWLK